MTSLYLRVIEELKRALVWNENFLQRIIVFQGDLENEKFGLSDAKWVTLCESVSTIYHNGAIVNMTLPYIRLKRSNVGGTLEVVNLAIRASAKIVYVSTVGALPPRTYTTEEYVSVTNAEMEGKDGYSQSKVVAEAILVKAREKLKLDVLIFRPCDICGSSTTGYCNIRDFSILFLGASIFLSAFPKISLAFNWVTVDYVASSIVRITIFNKRNSINVYHLVGDGSPSADQLFQACLDFGLKIKKVSLDTWSTMIPRIPETHPSFPVSHMLTTISSNANSTLLPNPETAKVLSHLNAVSHTVDETILALQLKYLISVNYF